MYTRYRALILLLCVACMVGFIGCGQGAFTDSAAVQPPSTSENDGQAVPVAPGSDREFEYIRINFAAIGPPSTYKNFQVMEEWVFPEVNRRLAENTDYQIDWNAMYGSVAGPGEELAALTDNIVDMSSVVHTFETSKIPVHAIFYHFPFCSPDMNVAVETMNRLIEEFPEINQKVEDDYNVVMLTSSTVQQCFNLVAKFPVTSLSDLKGHKLAAGGANLATVAAGGATPVQSSQAETYTSIQTGVYEGWINDTDSSVNSKLYEVAPYLNRTEFGVIAGSSLGMNKTFAENLPPQVFQTLQEVIDEYVYKTVEALMASEQECMEIWKANGGEIVEISAELKAEWAENLKNQPVEKARELDAKGYPGTEIYKRFYEIQQELGHEWPYTPEW